LGERQRSYVTLTARGQGDRLYLDVSSTLEHCGRLVWYEEYPGRPQVARRYADITGWARDCKIALIEMRNPSWTDLSVR
jgi:predicted GIY-YIG superfamily endonuclease